MVSLHKNTCVAVLGIALVLAAVPARAETCKPSELLGRVKSVIALEGLVDSVTGELGKTDQRYRIDVSRDGGLVEMTLYAPDSPEPRTKFTSSFENGRLVRGIEVTNGKTVSTTTCGYDAQGRLVDSKTQSDKGEVSAETYEYGSGFIRHRVRILGRWHVIDQTVGADDRVVKEVELGEERSTVERTTEFTYSADRKEECGVSSRDPRRRCATTIQDSHGNEIEFVSEGRTRKTSFEYDAIGNWISKRTTVTGAGGTFETVVQRKIEYW